MIPAEIEEVRTTRRQTLDLTAGLAPAALDFRPPDGGWSVGEVMDHVVLVEGILRDEIAELIRRAEAGEEPVLRRGFEDIDVALFRLPKGLLPFVELPFTLMTRLMPRKMGEYISSARWIPIRNPTAATPVHGRPGAELRSNLERSLRDVEDLLKAHPGVELSRLVHHHPAFGVNTVPQMLHFDAGHERRHQAQIRDVMAARGFPRA